MPKERSTNGFTMNEVHKIELLMKDRHPYFGTQSNDNKINSIRKWDQAFRVYTTIYVQYNPSQAGKILQYIQVIHTAASSYNWDSVAYYDFTFRQLMAAKPWRSWPKTYTQGWNLALREHSKFPGAATNVSTTVNSTQHSPAMKWKDDCCWKYNKNKCSLPVSECRWDHRCTYCGGWNHSFYNCRKRNSKKGGGKMNNDNQRKVVHK